METHPKILGVQVLLGHDHHIFILWTVDTWIFIACLENREGANQMDTKPRMFWEYRVIPGEYPGLAGPAFNLLDQASFHHLSLPEAGDGK